MWSSNTKNSDASSACIIGTHSSLRCVICENSCGQNPKILPCLHTACSVCIKANLHKSVLTCPSCSAISLIRNENLESLETNNFVDNCLRKTLFYNDKVRSTALPKTAKCFQCKNILSVVNGDILKVCKDCNSSEYFCDTCFILHFTNTGHQIVYTRMNGLADERDHHCRRVNCSTHSDEEVIAFCTSCNKAECVMCQLEPNLHLNLSNEKMLNYLEISCEKIGNAGIICDKNINDLRMQMQKLDKYKDTVISLINERVQNLTSRILAAKDDLIDEISKEFEDTFKQLLLQKSKILTFSNVSNSMQKTLEDWLQYASSTELASMMRSIIKGTNDVISKVKQYEEGSRPHAKPEFVISPNLTEEEIKNLIGKVVLPQTTTAFELQNETVRVSLLDNNQSLDLAKLSVTSLDQYENRTVLKMKKSENDLSSAQCAIEFKDVGTHQLVGVYDGKPLSSSPLVYLVTEDMIPPKRFKLKFEGDLIMLDLLDTRDFSEKDLQVTVLTPSDSLHFVDMRTVQPRLMQCRFDFEETGNYTVVVKYNGCVELKQIIWRTVRAPLADATDLFVGNQKSNETLQSRRIRRQNNATTSKIFLDSINNMPKFEDIKNKENKCEISSSPSTVNFRLDDGFLSEVHSPVSNFPRTVRKRNVEKKAHSPIVVTSRDFNDIESAETGFDAANNENFSKGAILGKHVMTLGSNLHFPIGCDYNSYTNSYIVCDHGNDRVVLFNADGIMTEVLKNENDSKKFMTKPSACICREDGCFAIKEASRIFIFNRDNSFKSISNSLGKLYGLMRLKTGELVTINHHTAELLFIDWEGKLIRKCDFEPLKKMAKVQNSKRVTKCRFMDVWDEEIYVSDLGSSTVYVTDLYGKILRQFGEFGVKNSCLREPAGISFDASGNVFIADSKNDRIKICDKFGHTLALVSLDSHIKRPSSINLRNDGFLIICNFLEHNVKIFNLK